MKRSVGALCSLLLLASCTDWDDHFDASGLSASGVEVYNGDIVSYVQSTAELSKMSQLYQQNNIFSAMSVDGNYTLIVTDNNTYSAQESVITDAATYAKYTISDAAVSPSLLTDGYGIQTRSGKSVWVYGNGESVKLDNFNITKVVKADNGYVYYVDGVMPVRQNVYEYVQSLPDDTHKEFKKLVNRYYERWFDREASAVTGVNEQGMTTYDSVFVDRNTLMDRYNESGVKQWDMFGEEYSSTVFIPTDDQIKNAINTACDNIPLWLNREPTAADTLKFEDWIVKACFVNKRLSEGDVSASADIFPCVGGCLKVENSITDETTYKTIDPAYWKPSVNTIDASSKVELSNGVAYDVTSLKIPNHIVIYRVKSRLYELWNAMEGNEVKGSRAEHFHWTNWQAPTIVNEAQGPFTLSASLPTMYYNVLTAEPTQEAKDNNLECSVVYDGLVYDDATNSVLPVTLPAGEYYLRMGFKHSLTYSLSISFKGEDEDDSQYQNLVKDMVMYATGSNFHFDRGAASEVPHYGVSSGIAYPEGFDVDYWQTLDAKAIAYDTDGYTVGIVKMNKEGNFCIKVSSSDMARLYTYDISPASANGADVNVSTRNKSNVQQLMMYHWCLRPTVNNY